MRRIIQANIERLKVLLETELDPTKRAMELRILAEASLVAAEGHAEEIAAEHANDGRQRGVEFLVVPGCNRVRLDDPPPEFESHGPEVPAGFGDERFDIPVCDPPRGLA